MATRCATVSGDLSLRLQPDFAGIFGGRTVSGSFRCDLPFRYASDDWRSGMDDEDERGTGPDDASPDDETEISLPGIRIGKGRVELPGIKIDDHGVGVLGMRIDDRGIDMPGLGVHIGKDRWIAGSGDPRGMPTASSAASGGGRATAGNT